jgi:hypothetical protein
VILRRLTQSLKEQNWTAIVIEFVLLVVGVFLGLQVSNWNEQREADQRAQVFTERLRADLRIEAWRLDAVIHYYADVSASANRALDGLEGRSKLTDEALLIAAFRATQYTEFPRHRATFDELSSTASIGLIRDAALRNLATEIYSTTFYENFRNEGISSPYRAAFRQLVPIDAQRALARDCGDKPLRALDYEGIKHPLDYDCKLGLPELEVAAVAQSLRSDTGIAHLLRQRIMNIDSFPLLVSDESLAELRKLRDIR